MKPGNRVGEPASCLAGEERWDPYRRVFGESDLNF